MFEVTVQDTFSSGHYLRNYKGKCENPHGHNYRVRVTLQGAELDHAGLLLDFKELKLVMKPVVDYLDHAMLNDIEPFTVLNPTAENLAKYFYDECNQGLRQTTGAVSASSRSPSGRPTPRLPATTNRWLALQAIFGLSGSSRVMSGAWELGSRESSYPGAG